MGLLLVLAGCNGGGGGTPTATPTATPQNSTNSSSSSASANMSMDGKIALQPYQFSEGESYTYNVTFLGSSTVNTWKVVSVDNGTMTVNATQSSASGGEQVSTIRGNQTTLMMAAAQDNIAQFFAQARNAMALQGIVANASSGTTMQLSKDNLANPKAVSWTTANLTVKDTTTVNGISCTRATLEPDSGPTSTACLAADYPFPLTLTATQGGRTALAMKLTNATRP